MEDTIAFNDIVMNIPMHKVLVGGKCVHLTKTEWEMLYFLIKYSSKGEFLDRWTLMNLVWGIDPCSYSTFKTHIQNLKHKLPDGRLVCVTGQGYTLTNKKRVTYSELVEELSPKPNRGLALQ